MTDRDVIVVGGGFAGLSAAVALADAGAAPLLLERRPQLGGRAYSFDNEATGEVVDNGQHVLMRCCTSVRAFLDRIGADSVHFERGFSIPFLSPDGARHRLSSPGWLTGSFGLLAAFLRFGPTRASDALGLRRAMAGLSHPPAGVSVAAWLDDAAQSPRIREAFWHPLCRSVMNAVPEEAPASDLLNVLAEATRYPNGMDMGWSTVGLSDLYARQARDTLTGLRGEVRTGAIVRSLSCVDDCFRVELRDRETLSARSVVLAVPPPRARDLLDGLVARGDLDRLSGYRPSPILGINLWFDRAVLDVPFVGLLGTTIEWVFDRSAITSGRATNLSLVVSASDDLLDRGDGTLVDLALADLRTVGLIGADESPRHALVVHEKQATWLRPVHAEAAPAETSLPGLYLAGDWTATGLPPTIEGAVRSGNRAAGLALAYTQKATGNPVPDRLDTE